MTHDVSSPNTAHLAEVVEFGIVDPSFEADAARSPKYKFRLPIQDIGSSVTNLTWESINTFVEARHKQLRRA